MFDIAASLYQGKNGFKKTCRTKSKPKILKTQSPKSASQLEISTKAEPRIKLVMGASPLPPSPPNVEESVQSQSEEDSSCATTDYQPQVTTPITPSDFDFAMMESLGKELSDCDNTIHMMMCLQDFLLRRDASVFDQVKEVNLDRVLLSLMEKRGQLIDCRSQYLPYNEMFDW
jgi:hypothetical protein